MNHQTIKQAFNQAADQYDQYSLLQQHIGSELATLIKNKQYHNVTDLGCGTGFTTLALAQSIHFKNFTAIDLTPKAINIAKKRLNHLKIKCRIGNFDRLVAPKNHFDLVFSSMSLQWSLDLYACLEQIQQRMKTKGIFAFSLPIAGSLGELSPHYQHLALPCIDTITTYYQQLNFKLVTFKEHHYELIFSSKLEALQSIKKIGAHTHNSNHSSNNLNRNELTKKQLTALTYNIAYFVLEKT